MNTSRRWMNLMRFSLNVAVSLQTIRIRSERTPFSNGGHSTTRNRSKLAQKDRLNHSCGKRIRSLPCRETAVWGQMLRDDPEITAGVGGGMGAHHVEQAAAPCKSHKTPNRMSGAVVPRKHETFSVSRCGEDRGVVRIKIKSRPTYFQCMMSLPTRTI